MVNNVLCALHGEEGYSLLSILGFKTFFLSGFPNPNPLTPNECA